MLFLRRFGHDEAQSAVTFAVMNTIGGSWRVVTLDDAEVVPIGLPAGTRRLFGVGHAVSKQVLAIGHFAGLRMFPLLLGAMWAVVALALGPRAIELARTGDPNWPRWIATIDPYLDILGAVLEGRLPFDAVTPDLPGVFAVIAIAAAISFIALIGTGAALVLALPPEHRPVLLSSSADAVREAERSKTALVRTVPEIRGAALAVARRSRRVFGPRLVVLRVASPVWREAVLELASAASLPTIDVSDPTENVLWEVEELTRRFGPACVLIGHHEQVMRLAALSTAAGEAPLSIAHRLARHLEGREILAYTTDPRGLVRFARTLRGLLLSRHSG